MPTPLELTGIIHGLLGTGFLMAFAGALVELVELGARGVKRLKIYTTVMAAILMTKIILGDFIYTFYRAPTPDSPRSLIKAGTTPWVHNIGMELKEHIAHYVPVLLVIVTFIVFYYNDALIKDRRLRAIIAVLLSAAMLWTLIAFGLGAYITKTQPLK